MRMYEKLMEKGIRVSVDAEELLKGNKDECVYEQLLELGKLFISKDDVETILAHRESELPADFNPPSDFKPYAKEIEGNFKVIHNLDVTGKSRTKGEIENFVNCFRNRFERLSKLIRQTRSEVPTVTLEEAKKHVGERVRVPVLITEKRETKKGNLLFEIEDLTGAFKVVFSSSGKKGFRYSFYHP